MMLRLASSSLRVMKTTTTTTTTTNQADALFKRARNHGETTIDVVETSENELANGR